MRSGAEGSTRSRFAETLNAWTNPDADEALRKRYPYPPELAEYYLFRMGYDERAQRRMSRAFKQKMLIAQSIVDAQERRQVAKLTAAHLASILAGRVI